MHVWAASSKQSFIQSQNTTLTLYIFSTEMRLLARKNIRLGSIRSWNIDFQYTDSCYYASIYYSSDSLYHILVKVQDDGTVTGVGNSPRIFSRTNGYRQVNRIFALEQHNYNLYSIKIEGADTSGYTQDSSLVLLEKNRPLANTNVQKLIIKKVDLRTKAETQKVYASSFLRFANPYIHATDSGVFAYSFSEPAFKPGRNNPYNGSFMFVAKLDSGLRPDTGNFEMLKLTGPYKHKDFAPYGVYLIDRKTFIVNRGWDPDERITYLPGVYPRFPGTVRVPLNIDLTNSFRITVVDEQNTLLKDTVIENISGDAPLRWDNRFITASDKKIDFFFTRQFRRSKNGMTHMYINNDGKLTAEDIIVDERYEYQLKRARKLDDGLLLVPYGKNDRITGLMKMQYETGTPR